jgi:hypothetical protein
LGQHAPAIGDWPVEPPAQSVPSERRGMARYLAGEAKFGSRVGDRDDSEALGHQDGGA